MQENETQMKNNISRLMRVTKDKELLEKEVKNNGLVKELQQEVHNLVQLVENKEDQLNNLFHLLENKEEELAN